VGEALLAHLRAAHKRRSQRMKVLAAPPEPDLPAHVQRIV